MPSIPPPPYSVGMDHFDQFDRNLNRAFKGFGCAWLAVWIVGILTSFAVLAAIVVGIVLAWKNWG